MTDPGRATRVPGSFRDPSGYLFERDGVLYRAVAPSFADTFARLADSGLYDDLVDDGLLVAHEPAPPSLAPTDAHAVIRPERIPYVSYPYEWSPAQLRAAALATLQIQARAIDHGMVLRDASAYNVQFRGTDPVFIDTLSFGPLVEGEPWAAYGQFCRHFLAPLALAAYVDVRLGALLRTHIDGIPLDLASRLLPRRTWLRPSLLTHLHLQARAQRDPDDLEDGGPAEATFSRRALEGLVDGLRGAVARLRWREAGETTWSDYYATAGHYSDTAMAAKTAVVGDLLDRTDPDTVLDLGANTGRFARQAAARGAQVVAADADRGAVEAAYHDLRDDPPHDGQVLPLVADLTNPSPRLGWAGEERRSLADRGPADVVMALALVHHLAIGNNVPLDRIVAWLARLGRQIVVEFVPKADPKVRVLLATREDVFDDYTVEGFEAAARAEATIVDRAGLEDSDRIVYLLAAP